MKKKYFNDNNYVLDEKIRNKLNTIDAVLKRIVGE